MDIKIEIKNIETRAGMVGVSIDELCRRAGIARSTFQRWKSGVNGPTFRTWRRVTGVLDDMETPKA